MDFPRELTRSVPFELDRASAEGDGLTLTGYAAVFDSPTRIDSWEGTFDEVIARGAFTKTLSERTPVLQFDHGHHPLVGSIPIGAIQSLREDGHGLRVKAHLHDNWLVEPVRDAIRSESITGMSFRFSVVEDDVLTKGRDIPLRTLRAVKLYELGPVVFPAYEDTSVGVRSLVEHLTPEAMAELAHLLGTSTREAGEATSDEDAASDAPGPPAHPGFHPHERIHAFRSEGVLK